MKRMILLVVAMAGMFFPTSGKALETLVATTNAYGRLVYDSGQMITNQNEMVGMIQNGTITSNAATSAELTVVSNQVVALAATTELLANKNQTNGYAGLDENGKISADAIDTIYIIFAGGDATDRSL